MLDVAQDDSAASPSRPVFANLDKHGIRLRSVHTDKYDLIENLEEGTFDLFSVNEDFAQERDLAEQLPAKVERLTGLLDQWHADCVRRRAEIPLSGKNNKVELDEGTIRSLRALGYLN